MSFCSLELMVHMTSEHRFHARCVCLDSDAHSTTSSASPAQSPSYSHLSDDGSDTELSPGSSRSPVFSFLDLTYWKRYLFIYICDSQRSFQLVCGKSVAARTYTHTHHTLMPSSISTFELPEMSIYLSILDETIVLNGLYLSDLKKKQKQNTHLIG